MRLTLTKTEASELLKTIEARMPELHKKMQAQFDAAENRDISKKQSAAEIASKSRENTAKAKILNAINLLRIENKSITIYAIAKESGCSYNTVKKYYKGGN